MYDLIIIGGKLARFFAQIEMQNLNFKYLVSQ